MKMTGQLDEFEDPLYSAVKRRQRVEEKQVVEKRPVWKWLAVALAILGGLGLIYYLFEAHSQIEQLNSSLNTSRQELSSVTQVLEQSQNKIGTLEQGLAESQAQVTLQRKQLGEQASRYRSLYEDLKSSKEELAVVGQQKADRTEVNALRNEADEIKKQVVEANSGISDLRNVTARNTGEIESTQKAVSSVREMSEANTKEIADVKHSLARDVYNFELTEKTGIMTLFNVALKLNDIDVSKQRFDLEIFAGDKRMKKNDQHINEPIYFYVEGVQKPYELTVTKLDKKHVVGYLSVPKS